MNKLLLSLALTFIIFLTLTGCSGGTGPMLPDTQTQVTDRTAGSDDVVASGHHDVAVAHDGADQRSVGKLGSRNIEDRLAGASIALNLVGHAR